MSDYSIDYMVPIENIPCSQWENINSRYHGKCKVGLFGGAAKQRHLYVEVRQPVE